MSQEEKTRVLVLGGFLGSGKTTLLLKLAAQLQEDFDGEYPIAIIENEIGDVGVDDEIIADKGYSVKPMLSGCACCTMRSLLPETVKAMVEELHPRLLVIEATGLAEPGVMVEDISNWLHLPSRACVLADVSRWKKLTFVVPGLLTSQVQAADVVCVSKCDLADEETIAAVEASVKELGCEAPILRLDADCPAPQELMDILFSDEPEGEPEPVVEIQEIEVAEEHEDVHHVHGESEKMRFPTPKGSFYLSQRKHDDALVNAVSLEFDEDKSITLADLLDCMEEIARLVTEEGSVIGHVKASIDAADGYGSISITDADIASTVEGSMGLVIDDLASANAVVILTNIAPEPAAAIVCKCFARLMA